MRRVVYESYVYFFFTHTYFLFVFFFFSSRRRHTRFDCDWSSDVCSSDLAEDNQSTALENLVPEYLNFWLPRMEHYVPWLPDGAHFRGCSNWRTRRPKIGRASCRERV